jgi:hypothetical protein
LTLDATGGFITLPAASANRPMMMPEISPTTVPIMTIISLGAFDDGIDFIIAASCG